VAAFLATSLAGCGWTIPHDLSPDYHSYARWTAAPEADRSADPTSAALALLPRFARTGQFSIFSPDGGAGLAKAPPADRLRVELIVPEYRIAPSGRQLEPMDQYEVSVTGGGGTLGVFGLRRTAGGWLYSTESYPQNWFYWDMEAIRRMSPHPRRLRLVPLTSPLSWWVVDDAAGSYAYPSLNMNYVYIAPLGSDTWERVEMRKYKVEAIYSRMRGG